MSRGDGIYGPPCLEARHICKRFDGVEALRDVSLKVHRRQVVCLLGNNGAGKSTLIEILSGVYQPDAGEIWVDGEPVTLRSPREARSRGIGTVYQNFAMVPLMPLVRNFFLGHEPLIGPPALRRIDWNLANAIVKEELAKVGVRLRNPHQPVGSLSAGERQSVVIARAMYFGASTLILDEPTSALGAKEASLVLHNVATARAKGHAVIFISHNIGHALRIGDHFTLLNRGELFGDFDKGEITREQLHGLMAGGFDGDE